MTHEDTYWLINRWRRDESDQAHNCSRRIRVLPGLQPRRDLPGRQRGRSCPALHWGATEPQQDQDLAHSSWMGLGIKPGVDFTAWRKKGSKSLNRHLDKTWKAFLWTLLCLEAPWVSQPWFWSSFRTSANGTSNWSKRGVSGRNPQEDKRSKTRKDNCSCRRDVSLFWVANKLDQSSHRWRR